MPAHRPDQPPPTGYPRPVPPRAKKKGKDDLLIARVVNKVVPAVLLSPVLAWIFLWDEFDRLRDPTSKSRVKLIDPRLAWLVLTKARVRPLPVIQEMLFARKRAATPTQAPLGSAAPDRARRPTSDQVPGTPTYPRHAGGPADASPGLEL